VTAEGGTRDDEITFKLTLIDGVEVICHKCEIEKYHSVSDWLVAIRRNPSVSTVEEQK
jgi:hypothetical protein